MSQNIATPSPRNPPVLPWLLFGCGGCLSGLAVFIALFLFGINAAFRASEPYKVALQRARNDPRVAAALGSPIRQGWLTTGEISTKNGTGKADLSIPIKGPKGKATLHVVATKAGGRWTYTSMTVTPDNGPKIDLLAERVNASSSQSASTTSPAA